MKSRYLLWVDEYGCARHRRIDLLGRVLAIPALALRALGTLVGVS